MNFNDRVTFMSRLRALTLALLIATPAIGQDRDAVEGMFQDWLEETVWPRAQDQGVSRETFDAAFDGVTLNWDLPDLVPPGAVAETPRDQRQAEFGSPGKYFNRNGLDGATSVGKVMASRYADTLAAVEDRTGVPARIVLGVWGRESGYGRVAIRYDAFEVLGTKGFMSTRADYFTPQLVAHLEFGEAGHLDPREMRSSWAGALGQPQFMPSNVALYGADGNGDDKIDIWQSEADTIASIAAYLSDHGWVAGRDWGFEVKVPASVSCTLEGPDQGRLISDWADMGITRVSGRPFPEHEAKGEGFLMMPAGRFGPAFVVTPNFYVLKDYNTSDLYALFVGHVGDRIQYGIGDFHGAWGDVGGMFRSDVAEMQRVLESEGHDVGGVDGLPGYKTRRSIGRWQEANGREATCFPSKALKSAMVP